MPASTPPSSNQSSPVGHHAGFGCIIFVAAAAIFLGLALWSLYTLKKQDEELAPFTTAEEQTTTIPEPTEAELATLRSKIESFAEACLDKSKPETHLELGINDLNHLLVLFPDLEPYLGMLHFTAIAEEGRITADLALPLNQMRFWEGRRYLSGTGNFQLMFQAEEFRLYLMLKEFSVNGTSVPEGFLRNLEHWLWLTPYYEEGRSRDVLLRVSSLETAKGLIRLRANEKKTQKDS